MFSGLDKITGRIISFDVAINETVRFGALEVTPRACYSRPPTEAPNTDGFIEVDELTLQGELKRIFTGWMFAASPGLNAVEHPIYDVWLTDCKGAPQPAVAEAPPPAPAPAQRSVRSARSSRAAASSSARDAAAAATAEQRQRFRRQQHAAAARTRRRDRASHAAQRCADGYGCASSQRLRAGQRRAAAEARRNRLRRPALLRAACDTARCDTSIAPKVLR